MNKYENHTKQNNNRNKFIFFSQYKDERKMIMHMNGNAHIFVVVVLFSIKKSMQSSISKGKNHLLKAFIGLFTAHCLIFKRKRINRENEKRERERERIPETRYL